MKKITAFMLMMVLCCLNTFAQYEEALTAITDLSELRDDAIYTIHSERTFLFYSEAVPDKIASGNGTSVGNVSWNPFDVNQQYNNKKIEGKYYLYFSFARGEARQFLNVTCSDSPLGPHPAV